MKYVALIWEIPRAIFHFLVALKNYARYGEFKDER
jgi:hypothetical protein